jgi:hypothetical protein
MKKKMMTLLLFLFSVHMTQADELSAGFLAGRRLIEDPAVKQTYGDGMVFYPFLRWTTNRFLSFEVGHEIGYKKSGQVGFYEENSTLEIQGWELCTVLHYPLKRLTPYVRLGIGYYSYKQEINSEFIRLKVDHHKLALVIGAGMNVPVYKGLFLTAEIKHVPLKVKPFDSTVDLSGLRFLLGLGLRIRL